MRFPSFEAFGWVFLAAAWSAAGTPGVSAQSGELRVDLGLARTLPPSGTDAVEASYLLLGVSGDRTWGGGTMIGFSVAGGRPAGTLGSDWA
ncbi:MAG: hypothetical protein OEO23_11495, partial [Gemmatimonadota bacterium]|nr:hypothetical protein [Gemmatimonadota bacterium]